MLTITQGNRNICNIQVGKIVIHLRYFRGQIAAWSYQEKNGKLQPMPGYINTTNQEQVTFTSRHHQILLSKEMGTEIQIVINSQYSNLGLYKATISTDEHSYRIVEEYSHPDVQTLFHVQPSYYKQHKPLSELPTSVATQNSPGTKLPFGITFPNMMFPFTIW